MADELTCRCRKRLRGGFQLECDLALALDAAPVTVLFGPSGAGKTTLLRLIAGLDRPDEGEIRFRGRVWHDSAQAVHLAPQQRRAGFLFQDYALFPHLSVAANVAYAAGPRPVKPLLERFGLTGLEARKPRAISGGEQQRVALARALAAAPRLLLLDEPLSALDSPTRARMRRDLRRILHDSGVPAIVVTHDRTEAMTLGDFIVVMVAGRVRQSGPVEEVFRRPADPQVAESVGVENVLPAEIVERRSGLLTLAVGGASLQCVDAGETGPVTACIHAEDVALSSEERPRASSIRNCLPGRIVSVVSAGPLARVELDCGFQLVAVVTAQSARELGLAAGQAVCAVVKTTAVHLVAG